MLSGSYMVVSRMVIDILHERPNHSCVKDKMPTYILKHWGIKTRGLPRQLFARKVNNLISKMAHDGYLEIYKSQNVRIRLGWKQFSAN